MEFRRCSSDNNDFRALVAILDQELDDRYGIIQAQYIELNKIESIDTVLVAYKENLPVGCGCFKEYDSSTIEIKRMFVKNEFRGKGIAGNLLAELENWAVEKKYEYSVLETGTEQPEAIGLYKKLGYAVIENYGQYVGNENSICMHKKL